MANEATVMRLLHKKRYKLSNASSQSYTYEEYLGKNIDTRRFSKGAIVARLHHVVSSNNADSITVQAYHDGFTDEDPGLVLIGDSIGGSATFSLTGDAVATDFPKVSTANLEASSGYLSSLMTVKLSVAHAASGTDLEFDLSVDLVLRS